MEMAQMRHNHHANGGNLDLPILCLMRSHSTTWDSPGISLQMSLMFSKQLVVSTIPMHGRGPWNGERLLNECNDLLKSLLMEITT
jgi:hypothetical protein